MRTWNGRGRDSSSVKEAFDPKESLTVLIRKTSSAATPQEAANIVVDGLESFKKMVRTSQIGMVTGVLSSDGPSLIGRNERRMQLCTKELKRETLFPLFSMNDVCTRTLTGRFGDADSSGAWESFWYAVLKSGQVTGVLLTPRWHLSQTSKYQFRIARVFKIGIYRFDNDRILQWIVNTRTDARIPCFARNA